MVEMIKKCAVLAIFAIAFAVFGTAFCLADDFDISVDPVSDSIFATEDGATAKFDVAIKNNQNTTDNYQISFSDDVKWSIEVRPDTHLIRFPVGPQQSSTTRIIVSPTTSKLQFGQYKVPVTITSMNHNSQKTENMLVFIKDPSSLIEKSYLPSITMYVDAPAKLDPREDGQLVIDIENRNPLNISDFTIVVDSQVNDFIDNTEEIKLGPLERKKVTFSIIYKSVQPPTTDTITVSTSIPSKNKLFDPVTRSVEILPYSSLSTKPTTKESFLTRTETTYYFNDGNVPRDDKIRVRTSFFEKIFTKTTPNANIVREQGIWYFEWIIGLDAQETRQVQVYVNYRPLFLSIIAIVAVIIIYIVFRSPIIIKKASRHVPTTKEQEQEGFSDVKLILHVKNRTNKVVEDVTVIDRLPSIVDAEKEITAGTLSPTKIIKHQKKGVLIKWELATLEPYEERIITYDIMSRLKIIGPFVMPAASVRYKNKFGRHSRVYSNKLSVGGILKE
jgi:hypothetical protein